MQKPAIFERLLAIFRPKTTPKETRVLITQKGKKYHQDPDCPALRGAKTTGLELSKARAAGYTRCDKCGIY